jgi:hypothetical protein
MPEQEPARSIQEAGNDREASGDGIARHVARPLVGGIQLARDQVGDVGETVGEGLADSAFGVRGEVRGNPCYC